MDYIKKHPVLSETKLIAYGQSIGGAVSIDIVARNEDKFAGLMIENTFLSLVNSCHFVIKTYSFVRKLKPMLLKRSDHFFFFFLTTNKKNPFPAQGDPPCAAHDQ